MKFSIVITNYNYERFVAKSIGSALAQDHEDVEVIVADDGSTDRSREVIAAYGDRVRRIEQSNGGMRAAYNAGYSLATGDVVIFLDADDWLYPTACSTIAAMWRAEFSKVHFYLDLVDTDGRSTGRRVPRSLHGRTALETLVQFGTYGSAAGSGNAYAAHYLRSIMPLDATRRDMPADSEPALFAPAYGAVGKVETSLGAYRIHKTAGSDSMVVNNMPTQLWAEFQRIQADKAIVAKRLELLAVPHRSPMYLAPWDARLLMLCMRFGGPRPTQVVSSRANSTAFAMRSVLAWRSLSVINRLLIVGWMVAVRVAPHRLARKLAYLHRRLCGDVAAPANAS